MKIVDDDNNNSKYEEFLVLQGGCLKIHFNKNDSKYTPPLNQERC